MKCRATSSARATPRATSSPTSRRRCAAAGVDAVVVDVGTTVHDPPPGFGEADVGPAAVAASPPGRRRGRVRRRPRHCGGGDGGGARGVRAVPRRRDRHRRDRRIGRHGDDHAGDARPAGGRAQGDGVDRRIGQRRQLRRRRRHRDDVLGHRRRRAQPHLAGRARQRRQRRGGHGGQPGAAERHRPAGDRTDDVRRHHAAGDPAGRGARRSLRPARVPRHRHRRAARWRSSSSRG